MIFHLVSGLSPYLPAAVAVGCVILILARILWRAMGDAAGPGAIVMVALGAVLMLASRQDQLPDHLLEE
jgi:hypothetical protein